MITVLQIPERYDPLSMGRIGTNAKQRKLVQLGNRDDQCGLYKMYDSGLGLDRPSNYILYKYVHSFLRSICIFESLT